MTQQEEKKGMFREFKDFLNKGDIITIAVGLIMALYFQQIINALLNGIIYPIIAAIFGKRNFLEIGFDIGSARINLGLVLNAVISFVIVAFFLFLIVKAYNRMRRTDDDAAETELSVLKDIRDQLSARNS
jgi:large conductance mechanosensitive channel